MDLTFVLEVSWRECNKGRALATEEVVSALGGCAQNSTSATRKAVEVLGDEFYRRGCLPDNFAAARGNLLDRVAREDMARYLLTDCEGGFGLDAGIVRPAVAVTIDPMAESSPSTTDGSSAPRKPSPARGVFGGDAPP